MADDVDELAKLITYAIWNRPNDSKFKPSPEMYRVARIVWDAGWRKQKPDESDAASNWPEGELPSI